MKSVQDWPRRQHPGPQLRRLPSTSPCLIGGVDPAADPNAFLQRARTTSMSRGVYAGSGVEDFLATKSIVFVDSITDLTRQAMA